MGANVAPWLQGLDDGWEGPLQSNADSSISSASRDVASLPNNGSRIPRRSLSGLPSSMSSKRTNSTQKRTRPPLAQLNSNDTNTLPRSNGTMRKDGTRSFSAASDASLLACGTVQQRSKSTSPSKKQETMEWKRRLVNGKVGYGDQTDLFGANGLENIFAQTSGAENDDRKPKNRMGWLGKSGAQVPSSPPLWSSDAVHQVQEGDRSALLDDVQDEEHLLEDAGSEQEGVNGSFRSNPFDLQNTEDLEEGDSEALQKSDEQLSSPSGGLVDTTQSAQTGNRTVSGQTELEQEDFSPVFISKTKTLNGQFDYAAMDSHLVKQFHSMKLDLRHPSQQEPKDAASVPSPGIQVPDAIDRSTFTDGPESESLPTVPDISFSENLPTGSPFPNLGKNIEMKRGGYSQIGSFKQRPLSPSASTAEISLHPSASGLLSPSAVEGAAGPAPLHIPSTPMQENEPKSRSSGSPLKLFGAHDTFTSNRLLRRLSQLNPDGTLKVVHEASSSPRTLPREPMRNFSQGSFGKGELDGHAFDAEITVTSASDSDRDDSDRTPGSEIPVPGSKTPLGFRFDESPAVNSTFKMKRKLSKHSMTTSGRSTLETQRRLSDERTTHRPELDVCREGKRPPTSPFKDPTPKRRRTLHASELDEGLSDVNYTYHSQLQEAVSSRKRRDARPGEIQMKADADVLAQRKLLRPRNPTPSQQRRQQIEAELKQATEDFAEQEPEKLEAVMEQIESSMASDTPQTLEQQAQTLASEVAAFTLKVHKPSGEHEGERKRSVTTQDFLDEAMMVMNLIRAKARPQSNLGSVEESDAEAFGQSVRPDGSEQDESQLRVSRPPSREGSGWRPRANVPASARVISHLRKFQERDERDDTGFIAESIASLPVDDDEHLNDQVVVVDEESNIRITGPPRGYDKDGRDTDTEPQSHGSNGSATDTQSTSQSTGRTNGTNSTRKSDNVGTLAPDAVAHLIGQQVGGMTFDKDMQRWVRVSRSPPKPHGSFLELPSNVTSDDDPFREISDLPVDEQGELRRISSPGKMVENTSRLDEETSVHDHAPEQEPPEAVIESRTASTETIMARPVTRDSSQFHQMNSSSVPSRYTGFASSQQEKVETRATSWSDEELARMSALGKARQQLAHQTRNVQPAPLDPQTTLGIPEEELDEISDLRDNTALDLEQSQVEDIEQPKTRQTPSKLPFPPSSIYRGAARQVSLRRQTLTTRFAAEAHEQSELSLVAPLSGDRVMSLSLSVSRPVSTRQQPRCVTELQSSPSKGASTFLWSDLPEFTVHEEDAERPSERSLATRLAHHAAVEVNDRYALAVKELVKILTDVNADEPFWEDLKHLDLSGRSLMSLHGLDEFCTRIQEINVSNNALTHLNGTPYTTRRLKARSNRLSSLTPWNHLTNLQDLDVSSNQLDNLDGMANLLHLRTLTADDNKISHINGIFELDGLIKLRLRRNQVHGVDFQGSSLQSLTHLDLSCNHLAHISNLDVLTSLTDLKLDSCHLEHGISFERAMPRLTALSLRDCNLDTLDVSNLPNLQYLNVYDNRLSNIRALHKLKNLRVLSMRRQVLSTALSIAIFDTPFEAATVRLSGNAMSSLRLSTSFLGIRHLDLASTGLQELPQDFGLQMANLRTLNLNFNSLKDVRPLLNIQKLETLSLCGNHLTRLRKSVATFARLPMLRSLDLRDTPLTLAMYPSLASTLSRNTAIIRKSDCSDMDDEDEQAEALERAQYEMPPAAGEQDGQHQSRMDEESRLRRRVYELLLANSCGSLSGLDGLPFDKAKAAVKDSVWERLVELGIVRRSQAQLEG